MPFVRVTRDKRGYEHIYLVHTANRRGKPARPRILYWFRTPPGVMVGREPFDEEIRRALETQNPDVTFDWESLSNVTAPPPDAEFWRERRRVERAAKQARLAGEREDEAEEAPADAAAPLDAGSDHAEGADTPEAECADTAETGTSQIDDPDDTELPDPDARESMNEAASAGQSDGLNGSGPESTSSGASAQMPGGARRRRRRRGGRHRRAGQTPPATGGQEAREGQEGREGQVGQEGRQVGQEKQEGQEGQEGDE